MLSPARHRAAACSTCSHLKGGWVCASCLHKSDCLVSPVRMCLQVCISTKMAEELNFLEEKRLKGARFFAECVPKPCVLNVLVLFCRRKYASAQEQGHRSIKRQRSKGTGARAQEHGQWSMGNGAWTMEHGQWSMGNKPVCHHNKVRPGNLWLCE